MEQINTNDGEAADYYKSPEDVLSRQQCVGRWLLRECGIEEPSMDAVEKYTCAMTRKIKEVIGRNPKASSVDVAHEIWEENKARSG